MTKQTDLIARLEAATEGSRELDAEIFAAIHDMLDQEWQDPRWLENTHSNHYTTSRDAAIPGEDIVQVNRRGDGTWLAWSKVSDDDVRCGAGATEPLARRIAAMKARAGR